MRVPLIVTSCLASAAIGGVIANVATAPAATAPNTGLRGAYVIGLNKCPSGTANFAGHWALLGESQPSKYHNGNLCKIEH